MTPKEGAEIVQEITTTASQRPLAWMAVVCTLAFGIVLYWGEMRSREEREARIECEREHRNFVIKIMEKNHIIEKKNEVILEQQKLIQKTDSAFAENFNK